MSDTVVAPQHRAILHTVRQISFPSGPSALSLPVAHVAMVLSKLTYDCKDFPEFKEREHEIPKAVREEYDFSAYTVRDVVQCMFPDTGESEERYFVRVTPTVVALGVRLDEALFIALRGTNLGRLHDIRTDFKKRHSEIKYEKCEHREKKTAAHQAELITARIHSGFIEELRQIYGGILDGLRQVKFNERKPLILCGHSLGGALAVLFAADFNRRFTPIKANKFHPLYNDFYDPNNWEEDEYLRFRNVDAVYTFGAPRFCKDRINAALDIIHHRFVMKGDPVPYFPSRKSGYVDDTSAIVVSGKIGSFGFDIVDVDDDIPDERAPILRRVLRGQLSKHWRQWYVAAMAGLGGKAVV